MPVQKNISLLPYNSFHLDVTAAEFATVKSVEELKETLDRSEPKLVLGGGSNILLTRNIDGLVLKIDITGVDEVKEDTKHIFLRVGAGKNWHELVQYSIDRNWGGLENLSLIPGNVGAAPIQNIGAYGAELKDVFYELEAYDRKEKKVYTFGVNDCRFDYRDSIFKSVRKGRYIILNVTLILRKNPVLNTGYGAIREELTRMGVQSPTIRDVSNAVIKIRRSKLPDPSEIGNAGSFFKNPVVEQAKFLSLSEKYPEIPAYPHHNQSVKLAAGWLIEQCGWKGYRRGDAAVHKDQALVLVNFGKATGKEIYELSEKIHSSVQKKFSISLEREVNVF
ncbi:MAG TPA: UDP-N-acetylmuramate dehydrogenase [Puia sp.]|jgi:UDP-N-acetylmuramate dehydrogenase